MRVGYTFHAGRPAERVVESSPDPSGWALLMEWDPRSWTPAEPHDGRVRVFIEVDDGTPATAAAPVRIEAPVQAALARPVAPACSGLHVDHESLLRSEAHRLTLAGKHMRAAFWEQKARNVARLKHEAERLVR